MLILRKQSAASKTSESGGAYWRILAIGLSGRLNMLIVIVGEDLA